MSSELYNAELMEHHRSPLGWPAVCQLERKQTIKNIHCGDELHIGIEVRDNKISQIEFSGDCCAVCRASSSILYANLQDCQLNEAIMLISDSKKWFAGAGKMPIHLSPLRMLENNVIRRQCAELSWQGVEQALAQFHNQRKLLVNQK